MQLKIFESFVNIYMIVAEILKLPLAPEESHLRTAAALSVRILQAVKEQCTVGH